MNTYCKNIILVLGIASNLLVFSQETFTRKIEKSFDLDNTGELYLENKYGNVTFNGWDKNKVEITVDIKVTNKKKDKAKELFERVEVNFKTADNFVNVVSEISDKNSGFFAKYFNKVNPFEFDKSNVEIHFTVNLPVVAEIEVSNKFGDVFIQDWEGKLKANVEHGDLWVNNSITNANINMTFGKLRAKSMGYATINLKNGNINIEEIKDLTLETSGTNIEIDHVDNLDITSSKDEVAIGYVGSLNGDLRFSDIEINSIDKYIDATMKVVDFRVAKLIDTNANVTINQESSDISINVSGTSFKFDATLEQGVLRLPKSFYNINNNVINKGKRIRNIKASYGETNLGNFSFTGIKGIIALKE